MGSERRSDACDSCGAPYGTWVPSLGLALCPECEGPGAAAATRDPVLVGDVLAGLIDAAAFAVRPGHAVPETRSAASASRPRPRGHVPEPRSGGFGPDTAGAAFGECAWCGARVEWRRTALGHWLMIEPGALRAGVVPARSRRRVADDGTVGDPGAVGAVLPSGTCRVAHADVCGAHPEPVGFPVLSALWRGHVRRSAVGADRHA
ncbi:DUF6083 domain-containing protein [Streptomyces sp. NPDC058667]|uniref:DUF6083 domain-containing protein n=1 Tax=Streptomyces sp. NPDC058667 TaxID=3346588 RepID=UPI00366895CE